MAPPKIDPSLLPIVVSGPFGKGSQAPHEKVAAMEGAICDALTAALSLPKGQRFVTGHTIRDKAFRKSDLNLMWNNGPQGVTEVRARVNGIVKRGGVEMVGVSVACLAGAQIEGWSEDLSSGSASKSGALLIAGSGEGPMAIDDAVRASATGSKSATTSGKEAKPAKGGKPTKDGKPAKDGKPTKEVKPTKEAKAAPPAHRLLADAPIRGMAVSPDGRTIATTHESQHVMVWDASTGLPRWSKRAGGAGMNFVRAVAFSPDGASLASGATSVKRFEVATGTELEGLPGHPKGEIRCIAWSDAGLLTVSGKSVQKADNSFAVWEPSGKLRGQWKWELPELAAFVPNEKDALFVSGYRDSRTQAVLTRFDTKQGKVTAEVPLESPFFAVTSSGVWVFDASKAQARLLGLEKLEVRATVALDGAVLHAADERGILTSTRAEVQRRDAKGKVLSSWTLPIPDGAEALLEGRSRGNFTRVIPKDLSAVRDAWVVGDRVILSTMLSLSIWSLDGKPILLPEIAAGAP